MACLDGYASQPQKEISKPVLIIDFFIAFKFSVFLFCISLQFMILIMKVLLFESVSVFCLSILLFVVVLTYLEYLC